MNGRLEQVEPVWDPRPALTVVVASAGYPGKFEIEKPIRGLPEKTSTTDDCVVFHGGTTRRLGKVATNGGRVLSVTSRGETIAKARALAYERVKTVDFDGACYRSDIGKDLE